MGTKTWFIPAQNQGSLNQATGALVHCVYWKDGQNKSKGCAWLLFQDELLKLAGTRSDDHIPIRSLGLDYSLAKARGKKWEAHYSAEVVHHFRTSPSLTKRTLIEIVDRWRNPPLQLKPHGGALFNLSDLKVVTVSHVYLVELLAFEQTPTGAKYYKIGKAKSIPKRVRQFGPCAVVDSLSFQSEAESLKAEAELHRYFDMFRRTGTEIFAFDEQTLQHVTNTFLEYKAKVN
jgi:hypothetical protein